MSCCCRASQEPAELRIVIVKIADTSDVMNTFIKSAEVPEDAPLTRQHLRFKKQQAVVTETPFLCHADKTDEELKEEMKKRVSQLDPGPHVFLLVFGDQRFTQEKQNAVDLFKTSFGKGVLQYTMAVFPFGKDLENQKLSLEDYIEESRHLKSCVDECKGGYHAIKDGDQDSSQGTELLKKINKLVCKNGGWSYFDLKQSEKDEELRKRLSLFVKVTAVAGACLGGSVASYLNGNTVGLSAALGASVGSVLGAVGIVALEGLKNIYLRFCGKSGGGQ